MLQAATAMTMDAYTVSADELPITCAMSRRLRSRVSSANGSPERHRQFDGGLRRGTGMTAVKCEPARDVRAR